MEKFSSYAGQLAAKLQEYRILGQKEASKSRPPSDAAAPDQHETTLSSEAEKHLNVEQYIFDTALTDASREVVQARQKSIQHQFFVEQLVNDTGTLGAVEAELASERQVLVRATEARLRAEADLKYFRAANEIHEEARYPESLIFHLAIIAIMALVEMVINAFFFENAQGLLGGVVVAAGLAVVNMVGALILGNLFRYKNLASVDKKIFAWISFVIFAISTIFINSLFSAFRGEYQLVLDPTEPSQVSEAFMRAWPEAISIFRADMVIKDQMSFVLLIVGVILSVLAFWKGYTLDDKYPGHGYKDKKYRSLLMDEQRLHEIARQKVKELLHHRKAAVHAAIQEPATQIGMISRRMADLQHSRNLFEMHTEAVNREFAMVVEAYRHSNASVRVIPTPSYFKERPTISMKAHSGGFDPINQELADVQNEIKSCSDQFKDALNAKLHALQNDTSDVLKRILSEFSAEIQQEAENLVSESVQVVHRMKMS